MSVPLPVSVPVPGSFVSVSVSVPVPGSFVSVSVSDLHATSAPSRRYLGMNEFPHERLDVYRAAIEFLNVVEGTVPTFPRGRSHLTDQLRRASTSICLNIAEGSGEFAPADKARFYRYARRSSTECAAILDACRIAGGDGGSGLEIGKELLFRIASMLSAMVVRLGAVADTDKFHERAGHGHGHGHGHGSEG